MTDRHQQKPYPLRMPDDLRSRLEDASKGGNRSLHAEIISRLERSFAASEMGFKGDPLDQLGRMTLLLSMMVSDKLDGKSKEEIAIIAKKAAERVNEKLVFANDGINHVELAPAKTEPPPDASAPGKN